MGIGSILVLGRGVGIIDHHTENNNHLLGSTLVFETLLDFVRSAGSPAGVAEALLIRLPVLRGTLDVVP